MKIVEFPTDKATVRRFMKDIWLPYYRELEATVDRFGLADEYDYLAGETEYQLNRLERENCRAWIAIDGPCDENALADSDSEFVGFIMALIDEAPNAFERPDRLVICEIYVREPYRGSGLADDLFEYPRRWARENGIPEFSLEVDVDNDRAIAFYQKRGFEPVKYEMVAKVDQ